MTAYADLEPCNSFDRRSDDPRMTREWADSLRAVGWLGSEADFLTGVLSNEVQRALRELVATAWQPSVYMGYHYCGLCVRACGGFLQDFLSTDFGKDPSRRGSLNLFVPGNGCVYVAPELIVHYVSEHQYQPPDAFCQAVVACPPMNTADYFRTLRRSARGEFAKVIPAAPWWRFWEPGAGV